MSLYFGSEFALVAVFFFSSWVVLTRRALAFCDASSATLVTYPIQCAFFWALTIASGSIRLLDWQGAIFFAFGGLIASGLGRWLRIVSIDRVGAPISSAVISSTPIFAAIPALTLLGEKMTFKLFAGTVLIIVGIFVLHLKAGGGKPVWKGMALSVISAACYGFSATVRKLGLNILASPIIAGTIGASTALVAFSILVGFSGTRISINREALRLLCPAGLFEALGITSLLYSYMTSGVLVTETLAHMSPLLVIFMSMIFLREFEKVTIQIIVGAIAIITGATLIIL